LPGGNSESYSYLLYPLLFIIFSTVHNAVDQMLVIYFSIQRNPMRVHRGTWRNALGNSLQR